MRRATIWLAAMIPVLLICIWGLTSNGFAPQRVPLDSRFELRVLQVSLGTHHVLSTEPLWKRVLRKALPQRVQPFPGTRREQAFATRHDALVLWVDQVGVTNQRSGPALVDQVEAVVGDHVATGTVRRVSGHRAFVFTTFARDKKEVPLRMRYGTNVVPFTVQNPKPALRQLWTPGPVPQTNVFEHTHVELRQLQRTGSPNGPSYRAWISARARSGIGWTRWRVTAFDELGNWSSSQGHQFSTAPILETPPTPPPWKLFVEGEEFVSAGFVPPPTIDQFAVLVLSTRLREHGVRFLLYVSAGSYAISNGSVTVNTNALVPRKVDLAFASVHPKQDWSARLSTPLPGVFCISDFRAGLPHLRCRVRERLPDKSGRVFPGAPPTSVTNVSRGPSRLIQFFPAYAQSQDRLEVEVIAALPPATFIAAPAWD